MERRADEEIQVDVQQSLVNDIRVDAERIDVEVKDGVVKLRGSVPTGYEKRVAAEVASRMKGVREIDNQLEAEPSQPRPDEELALDVRATLARDDYVDDSDILVSAERGTVYLSGTVQHRWERANAELDAWSVAGVLDVINGVAIVSSTTRPDDDIKRDIETEMMRNIRLDPTRIRVDVLDGTVYLRGEVPNMSQKWLAADESWRTDGVREVVNELTVG